MEPTCVYALILCKFLFNTWILISHRRENGMDTATGLDRMVLESSIIGTSPTALCANYTSVTAELSRGIDALVAAGAPITCLLTPEHGYWGAAQAGESDGDGTDAANGLPVVDTYGISGGALDSLLERVGVDQILIDLQDIGARFYTYTWTLFDLMCSAARAGIRVLVADRPNPLGRRTAGPGLDPSCASFVGRTSIPLLHGLTIGELARWFALEYIPSITGSQVDLEVIELRGWDGAPSTDRAGWVMPSPNIPTLDSAVLYPATCLLEGTVLSEGRGTSRPFELFGAGWTDARLAAALRERELPGLAVREAVFRPMFSKWQGETVHGAQLHLRSPADVDPMATAHAILSTVRELHPEQELWRQRGPGETGSDRPPFIDLLWGSPALREGIDDGADLDQILAASPHAPQPPAAALMYDRLPSKEKK